MPHRWGLKFVVRIRRCFQPLSGAAEGFIDGNACLHAQNVGHMGDLSGDCSRSGWDWRQLIPAVGPTTLDTIRLT